MFCLDCKEPSSDNAYIIVIVDSTVFGSVALYSCDKGYELTGDANRTCGENELWCGEQPICISMLISYHIHLLHYLHNHISTKTKGKH